AGHTPGATRMCVICRPTPPPATPGARVSPPPRAPAERSAQRQSPWPGSTLGQVRLHRGNGLGGPRCRSREHAEDAGPGGRRPGIPGRRVPSLRGFLPDHATPRAAGPTGGSEPDPASPFWTRSTLRPDLPPASPPRLAIPPRPVAPTNRWLVNRPPPLPTQSEP